MKTKWQCADCGIEGEVEVEEYDDVWFLMKKAGDQHDAQAMDCKPAFQAAILPKELK